jgi:transposase InsO family protein
MGVKVLRTPMRSPQANAVCERLVGTIRRECLDFLIPFGERYLRRILLEWVTHYNHRRPHRSFGPGFPEPISGAIPLAAHRHSLPSNCIVRAETVLGGLHHEYRLEQVAA